MGNDSEKDKKKKGKKSTTNTVAENIQKRIWELDITMEELAKRVGYSGKTSIHRIISGEQGIPLDRVEDFAEALQFSPSVLCGWVINKEDAGRYGYDLLVLAERLRNKGYKVKVFGTKEEAVAYIVRQCENRSVGLGASIAFREMGLIDTLKKKKIEFNGASEYYRSSEEGKKAINSEVFILDVGRISYQTAEIVHISSNGKKIAGSLGYANEVIFVAGKNKIAPDLTEAINKTKSDSIAKIAKWRDFRTPCAETGKCENCDSSESLCRFTGIYTNPPFGAISTVVLVDERIGY